MLSRNTILQNRYRIVRPLGKGGMGLVYEAIDDTVDSIVAIKETFANTDKLRSAFEHEAKLLANLKHPVLPRVMHHFLQGDRQFLVMEFVEGLNLAQLLELRGLPFRYETILTWADKLLDALAYLHRQREPIIHRDIKPANIKVDNEGAIYLLDFGLAKGAPGQETSSVHGYTAAYAPLEQLNNSGTHAQSDLYSLGATLYHLLTGHLPVSASKREEIIEEGDRDPLIPVHRSNSEVPEALSLIIVQAMAMKRRDRFNSAVSMREALREASSQIQRDRDQKILETPTRLVESSQGMLAETEAAADLGHQWLGPGPNIVREDAHLKTIPGPRPVVPPPPSDPAQRSWPSRIDSETGTNPELEKQREEEESNRRQAAEEEARQAAIEAEQARKETERLREEERTAREAEAQRKLAEEQARQDAEEETRRQAAQLKREAEVAERERVLEEQRRKEEERRLETERLQREAKDNQERLKQAEEQARLQAAAKTQSQEVEPERRLEVDEVEHAVPAKRPTSSTNKKRLVIVAASLVLLIGVIVVWRWASDISNPTSPPPGMAYVPVGEFMMGRDDGDQYERPAHKVMVKPFFIDLYEVTREDYKKCLNAKKCPLPQGWNSDSSYPEGTARQPVTGVTWDAANAYAQWAGKRLPTEEEWEYAARGIDGRRYPWGNGWKQGLANANGAANHLVDVGTYHGTSPYGAFDMVGNAWEWTASKMVPYPGGTLPIDVSDDVRVIRGGTYLNNSDQVTTTFRRGWSEQGEDDYSNTGFRCVKDPK